MTGQPLPGMENQRRRGLRRGAGCGPCFLRRACESAAQAVGGKRTGERGAPDFPCRGARTAQTQALARRTCAKRTCAPSAVTASHAAADGNRPVSRAFLRFFPLPSCRGSARLFPSAARFAAGAPSGPWTWKPALPACRFAAGRPAGRARR